MRKRASTGIKFRQKNEGKKLKFYDVPHLTYHVLQAGYDVKYFGDKGLGLMVVYVALGCSGSEAGWRPIYILNSGCASLTSGRAAFFFYKNIRLAAIFSPFFISLQLAKDFFNFFLLFQK